MSKRGILILTAFISSFSLVAQPESSVRKNAIYINGDITYPMVASTINYERNIISTDHKLFRNVNARIGYGKWFAVTMGGSNYTIAVHTITGKSQHHLEGVVGISIHFDNLDYQFDMKYNKDALIKDYLLYLPQVGLGYRYQKPKGKMIFRVCAGIPFLQCSIGFAF